MKKKYNEPQVEIYEVIAGTTLGNTSDIPLDTTPGPADAKRTLRSNFDFEDDDFEE